MTTAAPETDAAERISREADPAATIASFNAWAEQFSIAAQLGDRATAQEVAMVSLSIIANLFPDPNAEAHVLFNSLISSIAAAKSGRTDHILMAKTGPIPGTKRGLGHSHVGGYAISAVKLLMEREGYSALRARRAIAQVLTELGFSNRSGEHGAPKPVTEYAIRNWVERPHDFPLHHETAAAMGGIHAENLARRSAMSADGLLDYLRTQGQKAIAISRVL